MSTIAAPTCEYSIFPDESPSVRNRRKRSKRMAEARAKGTHTVDEWVDLKREFGQRCVRCGTDRRYVEKDHIIPIYLGGSDAISNIQPVCASCNSAKGPETFNWAEYRRQHGFD